MRPQLLTLKPNGGLPLAAAYRFYGCAQVRRISGDPGTSGLFETFDPLDPFSKQGQRFHVAATEDGIPDADG